MKDDFINTYKGFIGRPGSAELLEWLEKSDFYKTPASTKYHMSCEGGLCEHSLHVFKRLYDSNPACPNESIAICGLLHDLCKVNFYKVDYRNAKDEHGVWQKVPYYAVDDQLPYGHGEKSVYIISGFMKLTREESMAIRWHMGGFDDSVKGGSYALSDAFKKYPIAVSLHIADLQATYFDEGEASQNV